MPGAPLGLCRQTAPGAHSCPAAGSKNYRELEVGAEEELPPRSDRRSCDAMSWGPEGCPKSSKAHLSGGLETHKGGLETLWNLPPRQGEDRKCTAFSHFSFLEGLMEIKHKKVFILQKENLQEGLRHQRVAPERHPLSLAPEKGTQPGIWHPGALHGQGAFVDVSPSLGLQRAGPRVSLPCCHPRARSWPLSFPNSGLRIRGRV